ncbi:hypothetical protein DSO57_1003987 [Entomophthora muscae]|uniref:Uncharacterized protein n=1 Tax=Entomophthora muscae TaxID=34485 RepID=A0ACC2SLE5_9FUNG|nr:hypothetical protein DSO57_1003987 [Entomophthora muscae]
MARLWREGTEKGGVKGVLKGSKDGGRAKGSGGVTEVAARDKHDSGSSHPKGRRGKKSGDLSSKK